MFRRPRQTTAAPQAAEIGRILKPTPIYIWSTLAIFHLGAPQTVDVSLLS